MKLKLDESGNVVVVDGMPVYVHEDGKEIPFDAVSAAASIRSRTEQSQRVENENRQLKDAMKAFEGIDDPATAIKAIQVMKNLDDKKLVDAGDVERVKSEAIKAVEDRYAPILKERDSLSEALNGHLIGGAFASSKFISEKFAAEGPAAVDIARSLFSSRLKVEEGRVVGYDSQGNKLYSRTRPGELADAEEAIEQLVEAYPHKNHILRGNNASGSDKKPHSPAQHQKGDFGGDKGSRLEAIKALTANAQE